MKLWFVYQENDNGGALFQFELVVRAQYYKITGISYRATPQRNQSTHIFRCILLVLFACRAVSLIVSFYGFYCNFIKCQRIFIVESNWKVFDEVHRWKWSGVFKQQLHNSVVHLHTNQNSVAFAANALTHTCTLRCGEFGPSRKFPFENFIKYSSEYSTDFRNCYSKCAHNWYKTARKGPKLTVRSFLQVDTIFLRWKQFSSGGHIFSSTESYRSCRMIHEMLIIST